MSLRHYVRLTWLQYDSSEATDQYAPLRTGNTSSSLDKERGQAGLGGTTGFPIRIRVVHSHWSRNVQAWLSLVESFRVLLAPAVLCHKEPARASKAPY